MGLFTRKSMQERQQEAEKSLDDIVEGRGLMGKMTKAFLGTELTDQIKEASSGIHAAERYQALVAAGAVPQTVPVISLYDSGMTVNGNPNVVMMIEIDGVQTAINTLVSRIEIPRAGEEVFVVRDPQTQELLYGGLAPRE
ncbi:hypothetical protein GCM10025768_14800 [Microbacterium pseudoresistens]|uniref:Uncharacterized protein n=1 Tax=Microbacterium pseudoresistens TaxID=640634 RepID=A0A7Y9JL10_9MICO|nr:hypothetical protein [Microbacterium pseudoresistens]NYD53167.1 hypothetical protein [Microbacterium pseudoresistens]